MCDMALCMERPPSPIKSWYDHSAITSTTTCDANCALSDSTATVLGTTAPALSGPGRGSRVRSRSSPTRPQGERRARSPSGSLPVRAGVDMGSYPLDECYLKPSTVYFITRPPAVPLRLTNRTELESMVEKKEASTVVDARDAGEETFRSVGIQVQGHEIPSVSHRDDCLINTPVSYQQASYKELETNSLNAVTTTGPEWVGGVRALRDSHVRLVLRQLRHIEKLNRALDGPIR